MAKDYSECLLWMKLTVVLFRKEFGRPSEYPIDNEVLYDS